MNTGEPIFCKDALFLLHNEKGIPQERYFTYSHSPIFSGKQAGTLFYSTSLILPRRCITYGHRKHRKDI